VEADVRTGAIRILTGLLFCIVTACATEPAHISLKPELSQRIHSSNGVILAVQKEIVADVEKSQVAMGTGGGVLPELYDMAVDRSRANAAAEALRPIRDVLVDYDVGTELQNALGTRLKAIPWLHVKKVDVVRDNKETQIPSLLAASSEDALLLVIPSYRLSSNFSVLKFDTVVRVVPRAAHLMPAEAGDDAEKRMAPLYKTTVSYRTSLTVEGDSVVSAGLTWARDGGKQIKEALRQSIRRTADQIIEALSHPEGPPTTP
jgi:hypothetical protein